MTPLFWGLSWYCDLYGSVTQEGTKLTDRDMVVTQLRFITGTGFMGFYTTNIELVVVWQKETPTGIVEYGHRNLKMVFSKYLEPVFV